MFIVTARIPKKRLLTGAAVLICSAAVISAALLLSVTGAVPAGTQVSLVRTNDDRVEWLNSRGWTVSPEAIMTEELLVPDTFDENYGEYLSLQKAQGFDLVTHCGRKVMRYTYRITNYPEGRKDMSAALLIRKNRIIGGHIQSDDGSLLHGLLRQEE